MCLESFIIWYMYFEYFTIMRRKINSNYRVFYRIVKTFILKNDLCTTWNECMCNNILIQNSLIKSPSFSESTFTWTIWHINVYVVHEIYNYWDIVRFLTTTKSLGQNIWWQMLWPMVGYDYGSSSLD